MDEKLLDALNNLSNALTEIADIMSNKSSEKDSDVSKALVSGNLSEQINGISEGIKSIKSDTTKILSNQQTLLSMAKEKGDKDDLAVKVGGDENKKSMMKDGLATIMLIAVAVVALGAAFNLIGDVNIGSVIALSIAIPILAFSFIKISESMKESKFDPKKDGLNLLMTVVGISLAVVASSYILSMVQPVGLTQLFTTILIAGMFAAIGFSLGSILKGFKDVSIGDSIKASFLMPLLFPAIALAIVGSSYLLGMVQPVGLTQLLTSLAISILFVPLGFAAGIMLKSFKDISPATAIATMVLVPIVMIGLSYAIQKSSEYLGQVQGITLIQFVTALGISILFIPLAFAAGILIKMTKGLSIEDVVTIPITMVLMSSAVMLSSHILSLSTEIESGKLWNLILMGITVSIIGVTMGGAMYLLSKMGGIKDYIMGSLSIIIISTAIMLSSQILSLGDYNEGSYPSIDWAMGVGLSILTFGLATLGLGLAIVASGGLGLLAIASGALAVAIIATTIMASSHILSGGNYGIFPSLDWSMGVGLSLITFGTAVAMLGVISSIPFVGGKILEAGSEAVLGIAQTIVDASDILSKGKYTSGPTKEWASGIAISLGAFAPIYGMLLLNGAMNAIFGGGVSPDDFRAAIETIADGIVSVSDKFKGTKFEGGPSEEWALGVGGAIAAFAPIYGMLLDNSGWFSSGVSIEDFKSAINTIADGIIEVSDKFKGTTFDGGPTEEWALGVGGAIAAFAPVYKILSEFSWGTDMTDVRSGMLMMTDTIVDVGKRFSKNPNIWNSYPNEDWVNGIRTSIHGFADIVSGNNKVMKAFEGGFLSQSPISKITSGMYKMASAFDRLGKSIKLFNTSLSGMKLEKVNALKMLTGNIAMISAMDSSMFSDMMDVLEERSNVFSDLLKQQYNENISTTSNVSTPISTDNNIDLKIQNQELIKKMDSMISILSKINKNSSNIDNYVTSKIDKDKKMI